MLNSISVKKDFKIFDNYVNEFGSELTYLDSAATAQRPSDVIAAENNFLMHNNAAASRGVYRLSEKSSQMHEQSRSRIAQFFKVNADEIVFTKNATESLNLLAYSFGNANENNLAEQKFVLTPGDEIVVTEMEHHANLVPWQELCRRTGASLKWIPCQSNGELDLSNISSIITSKCKILTFTHQSNSLGIINPVKYLVDKAKAVGAYTVLDACQSAARMPINFKALGIDFAAVSGHKMLGPTGIGILYGKNDLLKQIPPFLFGGSMIEDVFMENSSYVNTLARLEPGVPFTSQAVGLAAALDYLDNIGMDNVHRHEIELTRYALEKLSTVPDIDLYGPSDPALRPGVVSFNIANIHPHDIAQALNEYHIALRVGHHCAKPVLRKLGIKGSIRASFHVYNDKRDIDLLVAVLIKARQSFIDMGFI